MTGPERPEERARGLVELARVRRLALTAEQRARAELVARRTRLISAGVRVPASGVFGREKAPKS